MSRRAVIALDVGGTTIDAACVTHAGQRIGGLLESGSPAAGTRDEIVGALVRAVEGARRQAGGLDVSACGIAMPGPFDYAAGISRMTHKFQAIRGVALGDVLRDRTGLPVYFVNDADAFGLGVSWRQLPDSKRFVALTIGTGLGSSFIEDGDCAAADGRIPPGGEVWNLPFGDGVLEDRVSARAVVAAYAGSAPGRQVTGPLTAKAVADLAWGGDQAALAAYRGLGAAMGRGLAPALARFAPEEMVVGGKVGLSLSLFQPAVEEALTAAGLRDLPVIAAAPGNLALWGAARYPLSLAS